MTEERRRLRSGPLGKSRIEPPSLRRLRGLSFLSALSLATPAAVHAWSAPPEMLRFQGTITSLAGAPVEDGSYVFRARICDATCTQVHYQQDVTAIVSGGAYTLVLSPDRVGELRDAFTGSPRFLEITVANGPSGPIGETLHPRQEIASVPFALNVAGALGSTDCSDGSTLDQQAIDSDTWQAVDGLSHTVEVPSDGGLYEIFTQVTIPWRLDGASLAAQIRENSSEVESVAVRMPGNEHRGVLLLQFLQDAPAPGTAYDYDVRFACGTATSRCRLNPRFGLGSIDIAPFARMCTHVRAAR